MKSSTSFFTGTLLLFLFAQCKPKAEEPAEPVEPQTVPEQIALAHGYDNWKSVEKLSFSFNFEGGNRTFKRSWVWEPKTNMVEMQMDTVQVRYDRKVALDSLNIPYDRGFINDRYWLLLPFNLMWDKEGYTYENKAKQLAPISADTLNCLTIVYKSEGGYTPGDAYDIFYDKEFIIREWAFRRGNQEEVSLVSTWEDYQEKGGLKLVTNHNYPNGNRLFVADLEVTTE
jgi:hypothetical protein